MLGRAHGGVDIEHTSKGNLGAIVLNCVACIDCRRMRDTGLNGAYTKK
jgi:hypothetical protein